MKTRNLEDLTNEELIEIAESYYQRTIPEDALIRTVAKKLYPKSEDCSFLTLVLLHTAPIIAKRLKAVLSNTPQTDFYENNNNKQ